MNFGCLSLTVIMAALAMLFSSCEPRKSGPTEPPTPGTEAFSGESGSISIAGSNSHIPVMQKAAKDITSSHPGISITIAGGGSKVGAQQLGQGFVDIANTERSLRSSEANQGLASFPFAVHGVAIIVHPDNPVTDLTRKQVAAIYSGKITNWSELGGDDLKINALSRNGRDGTRSMFIKEILDKGQANAGTVSSISAMNPSVASNPAAIGFSSVGHLDETVRALQLDGVSPTVASCLSGDYPVTRTLFMHTNGDPSGVVKSFVDFVLSPHAAEHISSSGFIPIHREG